MLQSDLQIIRIGNHNLAFDLDRGCEMQTLLSSSRGLPCCSGFMFAAKTRDGVDNMHEQQFVLR